MLKLREELFLPPNVPWRSLIMDSSVLQTTDVGSMVYCSFVLSGVCSLSWRSGSYCAIIFWSYLDLQYNIIGIFQTPKVYIFCHARQCYATMLPFFAKMFYYIKTVCLQTLMLVNHDIVYIIVKYCFLCMSIMTINMTMNLKPDVTNRLYG